MDFCEFNRAIKMELWESQITINCHFSGKIWTRISYFHQPNAYAHLKHITRLINLFSVETSSSSMSKSSMISPMSAGFSLAAMMVSSLVPIIMILVLGLMFRVHSCTSSAGGLPVLWKVNKFIHKKNVIQKYVSMYMYIISKVLLRMQVGDVF